MRVLIAALAVAGLLGTPGATVAPPASPFLPAGWGEVDAGPDGGAIWQGLIRNPRQPDALRPSLVYLPSGMSHSGRYPLLVVLHGTPGSTYSISQGLRFADFADRAIATRAAPPFVALIPEFGLPGAPAKFRGEWAGPTERFVVGTAVPWVDRTLPVDRGSTTIAGLSSGGFGAADIALRHPLQFSGVESWSGYFHPILDGVFRHASASYLSAHDPALLVREEAPLLRRLGTRFFLSSGTRDRESVALALRFAAELRELHLPVTVWFGRGGHAGVFWRRQMPAALASAFGRT